MFSFQKTVRSVLLGGVVQVAVMLLSIIVVRVSYPFAVVFATLGPLLGTFVGFWYFHRGGNVQRRWVRALLYCPPVFILLEVVGFVLSTALDSWLN
jgi:hypothetical protein